MLRESFHSLSLFEPVQVNMDAARASMNIEPSFFSCSEPLEGKCLNVLSIGTIRASGDRSFSPEKKINFPDLKNWQILPVLVFNRPGLRLDPMGGNYSYVEGGDVYRAARNMTQDTGVFTAA
jgi:hypothetical protein